MENTNFGAPLKEAFDSLKVYIDQQVKYNKLLLGKKMGNVAYYGTLLFLFGFLASLILIFLSFGFVWWFSDSGYGDTYIGFLLISLFYAILGTIIYLTRKRLIAKPIRKILGNILCDQEDEDHDVTINFSSLELLNHKIHKSKLSLEEQEKVMKEHFSGLGEAYTVFSISQRLLKSVYQSAMTTSNIARFTYLLVQRLKGGKKKKHKKDPQQIEE